LIIASRKFGLSELSESRQIEDYLSVCLKLPLFHGFEYIS
jgi:hypothetical protein